MIELDLRSRNRDDSMINKRDIIVLIIAVTLLMLPLAVNNPIKSDDNGVMTSISEQPASQHETSNISDIFETLIPIIGAICALIPGYCMGIYVGEARRKKYKKD